MDKKQKTKKKLKLSTSKTKTCPSNPHFICDKEVVIQLERLSDSVVAEMTASGSALRPEQTKKRIKLSIPKTKSCRSNPHFICDKEVVIQLERLSDSVVAEMTAGGSALLPEQTMEPKDEALNINSLPAEVLINIFSHLSQNELGKIARVCRRWNELTKSPVLWKEVTVEFHKSLESHTIVTKCFVNKLPSCVTLLRLYYWEFNDCTEKLNFEELCVTLQKRCPHLKTLILECVQLSDDLTAVLVLCSQFLPDLKNLIFCLSVFGGCPTEEKFSSTSKIEILGVSLCHHSRFLDVPPPFIRMPNLKKLILYDTFGVDFWFRGDISFLNQNVRELYICSTSAEKGWHYKFSRLRKLMLALPHLKTICLKGWRITCNDVVSLVQSFQSLQNVYVNEHVAISYATHPFVVANKCKLEIVKSIDCNHYQIVNRL